MSDLSTKINDKFAVISCDSKKTAAGDDYQYVQLSTQAGLIGARVWPEALPSVHLIPSKVFHITGILDNYQQEKIINIKSAKLITDEDIEPYLVAVPTLVFDIETVGKSLTFLDKTDKDYFINNLEKDFKGTKRQLHGRTGLYPMYGSVLTIGLYNPNSNQGKVLYLSPEKATIEVENFTSQAYSTESEMISDFWDIASQYQRFVTYNGSGFDFPFLTFRSAVNRIKVPFQTHGSDDKFVDLSYKFRLNNRPFKLETICKALDISNPKLPGISGMEVSKLFHQGKLDEIVKYVSRDVIATAELYEVWRKYLAGKLFI